MKTNSKQKMIEASMTIEAAIVFPIFIFAILMLYGLIELLRIYSGIQAEVTEAALNVAIYGAAIDMVGETISLDNPEENGVDGDSSNILTVAEELLDKYYIMNYVQNSIDVETLERVGIKSTSSLVVKFSDLVDTDSLVDGTVTYCMWPRHNIFGASSIQVVNGARVKLWTGYDKNSSSEEEEGKERYVYVTESGTVYHLTETCTHIKLTIIPEKREDLETLRNASGAKFKACEICGGGSDDLIFVTDTGDAYHSSLTCSGLKRTVNKVPLSEVEGLGCCSRCGL